MDKNNFVRKIMIDSRFRKSGTPGDFTYELKKAITLPSRCAGMVLDVEMVHSWYNIDEHNSYLYFYEVYSVQDDPNNHAFIDEDPTPGWHLRTYFRRIQIPSGNWTAGDLANELQGRMNSALQNGVRTLTATYNQNSGKIVIGQQYVTSDVTLNGATYTGTPAWVKHDSVHDTTGTSYNLGMTAGANGPVFSDGTKTLTTIFYVGGPEGSRRYRFSVPNAATGNTDYFVWNEAHDRFENKVPNQQQSGAYWVPPAGFAWSGVAPANNDTTLFGIIGDQDLMIYLWWQKYNIPSVENNNTTMPYDMLNPRSVNSVLGAQPTMSLGPAISATLVTGFLNLLGESVPIYITCPSIGAFGTSMGPRGENIFIKKLNTKAPFGEVIIDNAHHEQDYFVCGGTTLKTLSIRLVNPYGHTLPIQQDWSMSIVFTQLD